MPILFRIPVKPLAIVVRAIAAPAVGPAALSLGSAALLTLAGFLTALGLSQ